MLTTFSKGLNIKLAGLFIFSVLAIYLIPQIDKALNPLSNTPSSITVLGVGLVITLFSAAVLYFGINKQLSFSKKFILFTFLFNTLIIAVKFTLSPISLYEANQTRTFSFSLGGDIIAITGIAAIVFVLYFIVFWVLYLYFKGRLKKLLPSSDVVTQKPRARKTLFVLGLVLLIGIIVLTGSSILLFLPFLFSITTLEYLSFVFSTLFGMLIALALLGAIYFVSSAFKSVTEQAVVLRDVTLLTSFFWMGAAFLFIYHALWVVYLLVLTAIWPLRVVTSK